MDIKIIIKKHYKQLYAPIFDKLDRMDQFLERNKLQKFIEGEFDNYNVL